MNYRDKKIYSQAGQDYFVAEYFGFKRNGIFVDIGANDGIELSNTYYLEKDLGWKGICIEPIPELFKKLDKNRHCIKINAGIAEKESTEVFLYVNGPSHQLSGIVKEYDSRHLDRIHKEVNQLGGEIIYLDLPCITFNETLAKYGYYYVDYLNIDTEGNELKILKSIDFDVFDIKLISVENNYNDKRQTDFVKSKGYNLWVKLEGDEIFIKA